MLGISLFISNGKIKTNDKIKIAVLNFIFRGTASCVLTVSAKSL